MSVGFKELMQMTDRLQKLFRASAIVAALTLAACESSEEAELANLDNQIVGNDSDPALTSALEDQILVDPNLANQSNRNAVRPADAPAQAQYPARASGGEAAQHAQLANAAAGGGGTACAGGAKFDYNNAWAGRLPAAFAVYPGGKVTEAAGNNQGDCRVRVVTFRTAEAPQKILGWYRSRAQDAGYSAEQTMRDGDYVLGGVNQSDDGAFYLIVTPLRNGSEVALIANNGR